LKDNVNIAANFMPHKLSEQQKENLVETCQDIQERLEREPEFLFKMITGADKTWVYGCSQETAAFISVEESIIISMPTKGEKSLFNMNAGSLFTEFCFMNLFLKDTL